MREWLEKCRADGGVHGPEAVVDGLYDTLNLKWEESSIKVCVLIADGRLLYFVSYFHSLILKLFMKLSKLHRMA
jgi:hypothetical protein